VEELQSLSFVRDGADVALRIKNLREFGLTSSLLQIKDADRLEAPVSPYDVPWMDDGEDFETWDKGARENGTTVLCNLRAVREDVQRLCTYSDDEVETFGLQSLQVLGQLPSALSDHLLGQGVVSVLERTLVDGVRHEALVPLESSETEPLPKDLPLVSDEGLAPTVFLFSRRLADDANLSWVLWDLLD